MIEDDVKKQLKKIATSIGIPKDWFHTGSQVCVGGVRPSCPDHPDYWQMPRQVWCCPSDCPACKREKVKP